MAPTKEIEPGSSDVTRSAWLKRCLVSFRLVDDSGDGTISMDELHSALEKSGIQLADHEFTKMVHEVDIDGDNEISFKEFCNLAKTLKDKALNQKARSGRIPRLYLVPEQHDQYGAIFRERAGVDGLLDANELQGFFARYSINVAPDKLASIMAEVDEDNSGTLDETEFMVLLIKSMALKKRKVGPGLCDLQLLRDEGWSPVEIRRIGFECKHFLEAQYDLPTLLDIFSASELRRAGIPLSDLLLVGWDGAQGREAGFSLQELHACGVSVRRLRGAGYDDAASAHELLRSGVGADAMRAGGWPLSLLKSAGYPTSELRLAGYSAQALLQLRRAMAKEAGSPERASTPTLRSQGGMG